MIVNQVATSWQEYDAQAERFIVFAELASKYANCQKQKNPSKSANYKTFEAVSISVHHGFAAELLIKGIRAKMGICVIRGHDLKSLIEKPDFSVVFEDLKKRFQGGYRGHDKSRGFEGLLDQAKNLFESGRYHFEPNQNPNRDINADFTSFLVGGLREFLRNLP